MMREMNPEIGFQSAVPVDIADVLGKLERVGMSAVRRKFSPEFVNRIDRVITYRPLDSDSFTAIVEHEIARLQNHITFRLGTSTFALSVLSAAKQWLREHGTSVEYGARELKRVVHRHLAQPLAKMVTNGEIPAAATVQIGVQGNREALTFRVLRKEPLEIPVH
jgi:ATP-dependent Clp protease ATP-binding subunit ClpA